MTTDDLRDIAAHYGAACSYEVDLNGRRKTVTQPVNVSFLQKLELFPDWKKFKIHLRPLSALTDEQLVTLFEKAFGEEYRNLSQGKGDNCAIVTANYYDEEDYMLTVFFDGEMAFEFGYFDDHTVSVAAPVAPLTRQLQAWGYYVPGTIDEKYVKLIDE